MIIISFHLGNPARTQQNQSRAIIREAMIWRLFHKLRQLNESLAQLRGALKLNEIKVFQKFSRSSVGVLPGSIDFVSSLATWS